MVTGSLSLYTSMNLKARVKEIGNLIAGRDQLALKLIIAQDTISHATYRGGNNSDFWLYGEGGSERKFSFSGMNSAVKAYSAPVSSIITRKAQAHINGRTWILNSAGKEASSPQAKILRKLLQRPNPLQSWKQFEAQGYIYEQLFGFNVVQ